MLITTADELTTSHLTALLRERDLLRRGWVASFALKPAAGQYGKSHLLYHLRLCYAGTGEETPPAQCFLKFGKSCKEADFYRLIAPETARRIAEPPLPACYSSAYNPAADQACLLLEDLSETHFQTEWPLPPAESLCVQTVRALARLQAAWWQDAGLEGALRPQIPPGRSWHDRRALALERLPGFLAFLGDRLSPARRAIYERLSAGPPGLLDPIPGAGHTLLHGDLHAWNVLYPRQTGERLRFIDWNMWDTGPAADDLAYLIAVHWYPERRARLEEPLLAAYARQLAECGVEGYSLASLRSDYRRAIFRCLLLPAWQWARGILPGVWWPHLERIFLAFQDWGCMDLLA